MRAETKLRDVEDTLHFLVEHPAAAPDMRTYVATFVAHKILAWVLELPCGEDWSDVVHGWEIINEAVCSARQVFPA